MSGYIGHSEFFLAINSINRVWQKIVLLHCAVALEPSPAYCPPEGVKRGLEVGGLIIIIIIIINLSNLAAFVYRHPRVPSCGYQ